MSIRFSRVQATTAGKAAIFLVGGIPTCQDDLNCWTAFRSFSGSIPENEIIAISVDTFEYGGEEPYDATPEEVAYIYMRADKRPDFIESRAKKVGESCFDLRLRK